MKQFLLKLFVSIVLCASGYFYPVSVHGQNSSESSWVTSQSSQASSQWVQNEQTLQRTEPPGQEGSTNADSELPIGSGFMFLIAMSSIYLIYSVVFNYKKEEKK